MTTDNGRYLVLMLAAFLCTGAVGPKPPPTQMGVEEFWDADDWFQSGLALNKQGKYNDAASAFGKAIAIDPTNAFAWLNLGTMQALAGDLDPAIDSLKKAVRLAPGLAQGYSNLGEVCFRAARFREAADAYGQLLGIWPENANAHYKRGLAFLFLDEYQRARAEYETLKAMDATLADQLLHALKSQGKE